MKLVKILATFSVCAKLGGESLQRGFMTIKAEKIRELIEAAKAYLEVSEKAKKSEAFAAYVDRSRKLAERLKQAIREVE
jgi:hypothetical protein